MANEEFTVIVAETQGGKTLVFGIPGNEDPDEYMAQPRIKTTDLQVLTQMQVFKCPFCGKETVAGPPGCMACGTSYATREAQAALQQVVPEVKFGTRMWAERHGLENNARISTEGMIWALPEDWSELREDWYAERKNAATRQTKQRAENAGIQIANEAQANQMAKQKEVTDKAMRGGKAKIEIVR